MGMSMENGEKADDGHAQQQARLEGKDDQRAEDHQGGRNAKLNARDRHPFQSQQTAEHHHSHEGQWDRPHGAASGLNRPQADRDHRKQMVEATERMTEAVYEAGATGTEGVSISWACAEHGCYERCGKGCFPVKMHWTL